MAEQLVKEIPERSFWSGLPVGYLPGTSPAIRPPNLTDSSVPGIYHAIGQVPNKAATVLNSVSTRIGAPGLSAPTPIVALGPPRLYPRATGIRATMNRAFDSGNALARQGWKTAYGAVDRFVGTFRR